jgi:hypothetical protein
VIAKVDLIAEAIVEPAGFGEDSSLGCGENTKKNERMGTRDKGHRRIEFRNDAKLGLTSSLDCHGVDYQVSRNSKVILLKNHSARIGLKCRVSRPLEQASACSAPAWAQRGIAAKLSDPAAQLAGIWKFNACIGSPWHTPGSRQC